MKKTIDIPGMPKRAREGVRPILCDNIKPPGVVLDESGNENHKYSCVYVADGVEKILPCTLDAWKQCEGRKGPGVVRDGLAYRTNSEFILWVDGEGVLQSIDEIPANYYRGKQIAPDNVVTSESLDMVVNQHLGSFKVTQTKIGVNKTMLRDLISEFNKLDNLYPGLELPKHKAIVSNVLGNKMSITFDGH